MSLDSVKTKVLDEAKARAANVVGDAGTAAERIVAEGKTADERTGAEVTRDARLRLERETTRELERIQHDNRLQVLSSKNKAIDEVFWRIGAKFADMPDRDYLELIGKWLGALPPEAGGVLRVNPKDESRFRSGLADLNRTRSGKGIFTQVVADPKIANGAVVDGPDYTIDCTIDRRLTELRETSAGDLARVLFGA